MWILTPFLVAAMALDQPSSGEQDPPNERVLDEIVTEGRGLDLDLPKTGEFLFRPILYAHDRNNTVSIRTVEFVFAPVELNEAGVAIVAPETQRTRYKSILRIPIPDATPYSSNYKQRLKADAYKPKSLDLPAGTYVLSEVKYVSIETQVVSGNSFGSLNTTNPQVLEGIGFREDPVLASYCLSEGTILFDVENGAAQYLGALALSDLPRNEARYRDHTPFMALDRNRDQLNGRYAERTNILDASIDAVTFEDSGDVCSPDAYRISGWQSDTSNAN